MKKLTLLLLLVLFVVPLTAQEDELTPTFGSFTLTPDFGANSIPDPFIVTTQAGGELDATTLEIGDTCAGFVTESPDVTLNWVIGEGEVTALRIFFISDFDTTMIVQTPDGEFLCNDDNEVDEDAADPLSPAIDILEMQEGAYNIWIGTFSEDELAPGYIMFTELVDTFPGQITSSFLGQIVEP